MSLIVIDVHEGGILSVQEIRTSEILEVEFLPFELIVPKIADMIEILGTEEEIIVVENLGPLGLLVL